MDKDSNTTDSLNKLEHLVNIMDTEIAYEKVWRIPKYIIQTIGLCGVVACFNWFTVGIPMLNSNQFLMVLLVSTMLSICGVLHRVYTLYYVHSIRCAIFNECILSFISILLTFVQKLNAVIPNKDSK